MGMICYGENKTVYKHSGLSVPKSSGLELDVLLEMHRVLNIG